MDLNILHRNILKVAEKLKKKDTFFDMKTLSELCYKELPNPRPEIEQGIRELYSMKYIVKGTRLSRDDILANETRNKIYQFVQENPGTHEREVRNALNLGAYMAFRHLKFLEKFGFLRTKRYKNKKTFFPSDFDESYEKNALIFKDKTNSILYECIQEYGRIQLNQLSKLLQMPYTTIQSRLKQMLDENIIEKVIQDGIPYYVIKKPSDQEAFVEVKREFDYVGGQIRFKVAIQNLTATAINNIAVNLNPSEQFITDNPQQNISYLSPDTTRGIDFMLTPLTCGRAKIFGSVSYEDVFGQVHSLPIQPKEISIKCPLVEPQTASQVEVNEWIKNLKKGSNKVNFQSISKEEAFRIGRQQVSALDLNEVIIKQDEFWGLYSGLVKVTGQNMVVKISIDEPFIVLDVWADDLKQTTGFLAYITNLINLALESSYKMFRKTEDLTRKIADLMRAATLIDDLFTASEKKLPISNITATLQQLQHRLTNAGCDATFFKSVETFNSNISISLDPDLPLKEQLANNLRYNLVLWLQKIHEVIQYHTRTYKETFDDLSEISGKISIGITVIGEKIKEFEKVYGLSVMSYLIIIDKKSGLTLFEKNLGDLRINPDLVGGFLHALQSFGLEIDRQETSMRTLTYENFQFQIETGAYVRAALILRGSPNDYIIAHLKEFVGQFESNFKDQIRMFTGNMEAFQSVNALFDAIFK